MILRITNESADDMSLNQQVMSIAEFKDIHNHPWLVTSKFEAVVIDLVEDIPNGYLRNLLGVHFIVPKIIGPVTIHTVRLLNELYPEQAAKLMFTFMRDKDKLDSLLKEMSDQFSWDKYLN